MKILKRMHGELEQRDLGHGRQWFRGLMIGNGSSRLVYEAILKRHKQKISHLPPAMAVKSVEFSDSDLLQKEDQISDFGLAKRVEKMIRKKLEPYLSGSMKYLLLEVVADNIQGPPPDIWALGCVVVEMQNGKSLWHGKEDSEVEDILYEIGNGIAQYSQ
ncbi:hypothetical protein F0562_014293 [Nyssa sinensis]|uniref:Protein kinase domain-containing protein n=1 Tax=Nyssa sinensis TaxID=561372 RepID=A0A5J4ZMF2_9ASTE|nr:hypothetical protein F0562_014293 [Nyssa sinensis]